jgi:Mn-dependent DtxR family transcriptional regulator
MLVVPNFADSGGRVNFYFQLANYVSFAYIARLMKNDPGPSTSTEDYLERIHELIEQKGYARAVDIAEVLGISQPSVTAMVQKLGQAGYLNYERYRGITLTEKGRAVAGAIRERHQILERFLTLLQVSASTQEQDIEGIEHCLSATTMRALGELVAFFEANPAVMQQFAAFSKQRAPRRGKSPR